MVLFLRLNLIDWPSSVYVAHRVSFSISWLLFIDSSNGSERVFQRASHNVFDANHFVTGFYRVSAAHSPTFHRDLTELDSVFFYWIFASRPSTVFFPLLPKIGSNPVADGVWGPEFHRLGTNFLRFSEKNRLPLVVGARRFSSFLFFFFCAATLRAPFDPGGSHSLFSFLSRPLFHGLHLASGFSKDSNGMMTETDWFNHFRATPSTFDSAFDPIINNESDTRLFFFTGLQCHQCFLNQSFETLVVRPCFSHRTVHQRGRCVEIMMGPSCSCWASSFFSGCRQCFLSNNGWKWWPPSFFVLNFLRDTFKSPIQTRSNGAVGIERERETRKNVECFRVVVVRVGCRPREAAPRQEKRWPPPVSACAAFTGFIFCLHSYFLGLFFIIILSALFLPADSIGARASPSSRSQIAVSLT